MSTELPACSPTGVISFPVSVADTLQVNKAAHTLFPVSEFAYHLKD